MNKRIGFVVITAIVMMLSSILISCGDGVKADDERMVTISREGYGYIVYDRETGVEYWMSGGSYNLGNLNVLYNEDGKPLIFERN